MTTATPLLGRTALVSGGGSGLGAAMARALGAAGARVVLVGRTLAHLDRVSDELRATGVGVRRETCDVSSASQVDDLAAALADEDVSVLVNNAGIGGPVAPIVDIGPGEWDEVFASNVRSVYLMCHAFLPRMYERADGDVVNVASVTGKRPLVDRTPYAASKMAVLGLTRTLAFEAGPRGVRVNSLSPGPVDGERMARNFRLAAERSGASVEAERRAFASRSALDRLVREDEVAAGLVAMLQIPGLCGADIDLSAGMVAPS